MHSFQNDIFSDTLIFLMSVFSISYFDTFTKRTYKVIINFIDLFVDHSIIIVAYLLFLNILILTKMLLFCLLKILNHYQSLIDKF